MHLNKISGRTFHDLMQYPIFPFVLSDYHSVELDLDDEKSFRRLQRPMAVQDPEKEKYFIAKYNSLQQEVKNNTPDSSNPVIGPFHYGSHYSNSGIVLHYMIRIPPFTKLFLDYQGGDFDLPDRMFHSMQNTWNLASKDSSTDVKGMDSVTIQLLNFYPAADIGFSFQNLFPNFSAYQKC